VFIYQYIDPGILDDFSFNICNIMILGRYGIYPDQQEEQEATKGSTSFHG
jgi:hypothetical protein